MRKNNETRYTSIVYSCKTTRYSFKTYIARLDTESENLWEITNEEEEYYPQCIAVDNSNEPEIVVGGAFRKGPMSFATYLAGTNQDGEYFDVGSSSFDFLSNIIKENGIIYTCFIRNIAAFDGIPPHLVVPGFNAGILIVVTSLVTIGLYIKNKRKIT